MQSPGPCLGLEIARQVGCQNVRLKRLEDRRQRAFLKSLGVEQVLHQEQQLLGLSVNSLDPFAVPVAERPLAQENAAVALDERQRSSQLVRGDGDELALHVLEQLKLARHLIEGPREHPDLIPFRRSSIRTERSPRVICSTASPQRDHARPEGSAQRQRQEQGQSPGGPQAEHPQSRKSIDGVGHRRIVPIEPNGRVRNHVFEVTHDRGLGCPVGLPIGLGSRGPLENPRRRASQVRELMAQRVGLLRVKPRLAADLERALGARQAASRRLREAGVIREEGMILECRSALR